MRAPATSLHPKRLWPYGFRNRGYTLTPNSATAPRNPYRRSNAKFDQCFLSEDQPADTLRPGAADEGSVRDATCTGSSHASIARQPSQNRIRLHERVPTESQCSTLGPRCDHCVVAVGGHQEWCGNAGVDRRDRRRGQRRPESISANIISSVTSVSERATKRPFISRSTRAVLPPGSDLQATSIRRDVHLRSRGQPERVAQLLGQDNAAAGIDNSFHGIRVPTRSHSRHRRVCCPDLRRHSSEARA
ncbi:hypothetical protein BH11ACT7_BH11ACT7_02900 [soil metagenome]